MSTFQDEQLFLGCIRAIVAGTRRSERDAGDYYANKDLAARIWESARRAYIDGGGSNASIVNSMDEAIEFARNTGD